MKRRSFLAWLGLAPAAAIAPAPAMGAAPHRLLFASSLAAARHSLGIGPDPAISEGQAVLCSPATYHVRELSPGARLVIREGASFEGASAKLQAFYNGELDPFADDDMSEEALAFWQGDAPGFIEGDGI